MATKFSCFTVSLSIHCSGSLGNRSSKQGTQWFLSDSYHQYGSQLVIAVVAAASDGDSEYLSLEGECHSDAFNMGRLCNCLYKLSFLKEKAVDCPEDNSSSIELLLIKLKLYIAQAMNNLLTAQNQLRATQLLAKPATCRSTHVSSHSNGALRTIECLTKMRVPNSVNAAKDGAAAMSDSTLQNGAQDMIKPVKGNCCSRPHTIDSEVSYNPPAASKKTGLRVFLGNAVLKVSTLSISMMLLLVNLLLPVLLLSSANCLQGSWNVKGNPTEVTFILMAVCSIQSVAALPAQSSTYNGIQFRDARMVTDGIQKVLLKGSPNSGFCAWIAIGRDTPQEFCVLIDTGSANLAVAGSAQLATKNYFHTDLSSTYSDLGRTVSVSYTAGDWTGTLSQDYISFSGSTNNISAQFVLITKATRFYLPNADWEGILGMAYSSLVKPDSSVKTFWDTFRDANKMEDVFSLQLCPPIDNPAQNRTELRNGIMALGGSDSDDYQGRIHYTDIIQQKYYGVVITNLTIGNNHIELPCKEFNNDQTIVDSGTTDIFFPVKVFTEMEKALSSSVKNNTLLTVPDSFWLGGSKLAWPTEDKGDIYKMFPTIFLGFAVSANSSEEFSLGITPQIYLRQVQGSRDEQVKTNCFPECDFFEFGIKRRERGTVIGGNVMLGFYTVFNRKERQVGFAEPAYCEYQDYSTLPYIVGPYQRVPVDCECKGCSPGPAYWEIISYTCGCIVFVLAVGLIVFVFWTQRRHSSCNCCSSKRKKISQSLEEDTHSPKRRTALLRNSCCRCCCSFNKNYGTIISEDRSQLLELESTNNNEQINEPRSPSETFHDNVETSFATRIEAEALCHGIVKVAVEVDVHNLQRLHVSDDIELDTEELSPLIQEETAAKVKEVFDKLDSESLMEGPPSLDSGCVVLSSIKSTSTKSDYKSDTCLDSLELKIQPAEVTNIDLDTYSESVSPLVKKIDEEASEFTHTEKHDHEYDFGNSDRKLAVVVTDRSHGDISRHADLSTLHPLCSTCSSSTDPEQSLTPCTSVSASKLLSQTDFHHSQDTCTMSCTSSSPSQCRDNPSQSQPILPSIQLQNVKHCAYNLMQERQSSTDSGFYSRQSSTSTSGQEPRRSSLTSSGNLRLCHLSSRQESNMSTDSACSGSGSITDIFKEDLDSPERCI